ncbi:hypothetical protein [Hymenobacter sp. BT491]|uniref:hypothetical protein n=1 Tax=Hymenobacter sp. BT491 TaxID=2766779 RepID=UPI001653B88E|nr:hypothetical protein [Hymenobacter sp. BT491]MBC6990024.1 hypothetical protein [Hymenobacter sp. BT491]
MPHRYLSCSLLLLLASGCARKAFFQTDARLSDGPAAPTDSARVVAGRHYLHGRLYNVFMGAHYRSVWASPVVVPTFNPQTAVAGGVEAGKMGGGFQSTSMTLDGHNGRAYALRTLDKDPYKTLPKIFQKTFVLNVVRDATSAANPYAAFVVPPLAEAAGVFHTNPQLYYISPKETALGPYSERFRGKVVMLEEKYNGPANLTPAFGKATDLKDTEDMLRKRYTDPTHQVDQLAFARARLLDIWLGDWDRHEGQWQWAVYEQAGGRTQYCPIPKDRDQVFYRFDDGLIPWLASRKWGVRKFRTFKPEYEDIAGLVRNARFIDARALSEVTAQQFQQLATNLQQRLTDNVIEKAIRRMPPSVYALEGARTIKALKKRRSNLPAAAHTFYRLLAEQVTVVGTDADEHFVVERLSDSTTQVSMYRIPDESEKAPADTLLYRRLFRTNETKRLVLHGLDGKDVFEVRGNVKRGIRTDIYGGPNEDTVLDTSHVRGWSKKTRYYDTNRGNELTKGSETKDKTEKGVLMHAYDREGY